MNDLRSRPMPDPTDLRAALAALVNWHDRVILEPDADVWAAARAALSVPDARDGWKLAAVVGEDSFDLYTNDDSGILIKAAAPRKSIMFYRDLPVGTLLYTHPKAEPAPADEHTREGLTAMQARAEVMTQLGAQSDAAEPGMQGLIESAPPFCSPAQAPAEPVAHVLTFDAFRVANKARCLKWHPAGIDSWSPSDWLTAVTGELGELASLLKMRNRERDGLPGNKFSPTDKQVADEVADVLTYLDLLAEVLGVDLGRAAAQKFNEVSERVGFPDRLCDEIADRHLSSGRYVSVVADHSTRAGGQVDGAEECARAIRGTT